MHRRAEFEAEKRRLEAEAAAQQEAADRAEREREEAYGQAKQTTDAAEQARLDQQLGIAAGASPIDSLADRIAREGRVIGG